MTLLLGPYAYTAGTIIMRNNLRVLGISGSMSPGGTYITGATNNPIFRGPPLPKDKPAVEVELKDITISGPGHTSCAAGPGAGGDGIYSDANEGQGVWFLRLENVTVCNLAGVDLHFRGSSSGTGRVNQWVSLENVRAFRGRGGKEALRVEGANYQFHINHSWFDANALDVSVDTSAAPNIYLSGGPGPNVNGFPLNFNFQTVTSEGAATLVQIDGAINIVFNGMHHETACQGYRITYGVGGAKINTSGITVSNTSFNDSVGRAAVKGCGSVTNYLGSIDTPNAAGIVFDSNTYASNTYLPDNLVTTTAGAGLIQHDWTFYGNSGGTKRVAYVQSSGTAALSGGTKTVSFQVPYAYAPVVCFANGTAIPAAMLAVGSASSVTVTSSSSADTQTVNWTCNNPQN